MIVNGKSLLAAAPLDPMVQTKMREHGVSYGLAEAGVDIRIRQTVRFVPPDEIEFWRQMRRWERATHLDTPWPEIAEAFHGYVEVEDWLEGEDHPTVTRTLGRFALASSVERFSVPAHLVAIMGHKSTWARRGVNVWAGTTAEPGWEGWLTLEIGFHGNEPVHIPAGSGIAQVLFHELAEAADYGGGKYQGQPDRPVAAIMEGE